MMVLGIKQKMFLSMLIGVLVLVLSMSFFMRWSFDRNFLNYVNTQEQNALSSIAQQVQHLYQQADGWQRLQGNQPLWHAILRNSRGVAAAQRPSLRADKGGAPHLNRPFVGGLERRLLLLDADKQWVVGAAPPGKHNHLPLRVGQQVVGYLALAPQKNLSELHQLDFVKAQKKAFALITLVVVVAAAVLSLPLSQQLVRRVKMIAEGMHQLAAGHYQTRIAAGAGDELGQLEQDFNALALTLGKNETLRRAWVADISHELRTPLTILRGEIEAIQDGVRVQTAQTLEVLHGEVMHLGRLVEDLYELSMSDVGALNYKKTTVDVAALLAESVARFAPRFSEKNLVVELLAAPPALLPVFADAERLQQLFSNVLENSLRYTDSGGRVEIRITQRPGWLDLEICDSKPGVATADLPHLFERLFRGESSRNRALGGGGLGLSICRNIVEAHGGRIAARHSPLGGLCLGIELPQAGGKEKHV